MNVQEPNRRQARRKRVVLAVTASILVGCLLFACGDAEKTPLGGGDAEKAPLGGGDAETAPPGRPLPPRVRLAVAERSIFHHKRLKGADQYHFGSGQDGEFWIFLQEMFSPLKAWRITKGNQEPFQAVSPADWEYVDRVSVSNNNAGHPVVIMMGWVKDAGDTRVVARTWTGKEWADPDPIDQFDGSGTFGQMISYLDSKGRTHVVYDRPLDRRESYGFMAGYFPDKCFHAFYTGQRWSTAKSTTGRGKFYLDPLSLGELADGTIYLGLDVRSFTSFGYKAQYRGCQRWDGQRWSQVEEDMPDGADAKLDFWGNRLSELPSPGQSSDDIGRGGTMLRREANGRIIACSWNWSQATLGIWDGREWAKEVTFPVVGGVTAKAHLLTNPDGNAYWVEDERSRVVIQRIRLLPTE